MIEEAVKEIARETLLEVLPELMEEYGLEKKCNSKVEINLTECAELIGRPRQYLADTFYIHKDEVSDFVVFPNVHNRHWRILREPLIEWWKENFRKVD